MFTLIGSVVVLLCVCGSFVMEGGSLLLLWHPGEVMIIVGSAFGAFVTSNPIKVVKGPSPPPSGWSRVRATSARTTSTC